MNDQSNGIVWTHTTWNPMSGCQKISPGCKYCYAHTLAENKRGTNAFPNGFDLTIRPHKLREPLRLKEPSLIFVNSMSDLFWEKVPMAYRDQIVDVIEQTPQHQYQVLTKRPEAMLEYSKRRKLPSNFWAGVSIESQKYAWRGDVLRQVDAEIHFFSLEPLLSSLPELNLDHIEWVITGGESGTHLTDKDVRDERGLVQIDGAQGFRPNWITREDRIDWIREIRDNCVDRGVAFLHKQWGGWNSHAAGRDLDGRTWDQFPRMPSDKPITEFRKGLFQ